MSINTLCVTFRRISISKQSNIIARYCSTQLSRQQSRISAPSVHLDGFSNNLTSETLIKFAPRTLNIDFGIPVNSGVTRNIIDIPFQNIQSMEEPVSRLPLQRDLPLSDKSLEFPTRENVAEKRMNSMIRIRRQKMKKHKRRKLRKRMQFEWAKIRQRRNVLKEKVFQAELIAKIEEAQKFDAKAYVKEKLATLQKEFIPKTYRGEIVPPALLKQLRAEKRAKKEAYLNKPRLTL